MFGVAARLAIGLSLIAALTAIVLDAIGDVSRVSLVLSVAAVGFVASWVMTGRAQQVEVIALTERPVGHRVAVVPVRHTVG